MCAILFAAWAAFVGQIHFLHIHHSTLKCLTSTGNAEVIGKKLTVSGQLCFLRDLISAWYCWVWNLKRTGNMVFYIRVLTVVVCSKPNELPVNRFFPTTSNSEEGVLFKGRVSGVGDCVVGVSVLWASVVVGSGTGVVVVSSKSPSVR